MLFFILVALALGASIICKQKRTPYWLEEFCDIIKRISVVSLCICLLFAIGFQIATRVDFAEVTSKIESNTYKNFPEIIQAEIDAGIVGDLSNEEIGKNLSDRIQEWYDSIEYNNATIKATKIFNNSLLLDAFTYDWPYYPPLINIDSIKFSLNKTVHNMQAAPILTIGK